MACGMCSPPDSSSRSLQESWFTFLSDNAETGEATAFGRRDGARLFRSASVRQILAWLAVLLVALIAASFAGQGWRIAIAWALFATLVILAIHHRLNVVRTMRILAEARARLSREVEERTHELSRSLQYLDVALRGLEVTVFSQDRKLRFTYMSAPSLRFRLDIDPIGKTDQELWPSDLASRLSEFKNGILQEAKAAQMEFRVCCEEHGEAWFRIWAEPARDGAGNINGLVGAITEITEQRQRDTHNRILLRELTHRTKNLLSVIQAMARQTLTDAATAREFEERFSARLQGLASSLDLLVSANWGGASIQDLFRSQLGHFAELIGHRIKLSGPEMRLTPEAAQNLGLALHELATNSAKYGALSNPDGVIAVAWLVEGSGAEKNFWLQWRENGGPPIKGPRKKGFGHAVIEKLVPRALGGTGMMALDPDGVVWTLEAPLMNVITVEDGDQALLSEPGNGTDVPRR
jgi:two-component sensor histidine kinase